MFRKLTVLAAVCALSASSVFAGGLSPEIIESTDDDVAAVAGPSINPTYIVIGVIAALLIAAAVSDNDDDDDGDDGGDDRFSETDG